MDLSFARAVARDRSKAPLPSFFSVNGTGGLPSISTPRLSQ